MFKFKKKNKYKYIQTKLSIYFGVPGAGKTTIAAALAKQHLKRGLNVFSNVPISGCYQFSKDMLGRLEISDGLLILDEASCEFHARKFKEMTIDQIEFFKKFRHWKLRVAAFSQGWDDCDKVLKILAYDYWLVKKSLLPFFICAVPIRRRVDINEQTKEICDAYSFDHPLVRLFTTKRYFAPRYWKMFDSWDRPQLPKKVWDTW